MSRYPSLWPSVISHLKTTQPDNPVLYFAPAVLALTAQRFQNGFPGLVTYAVKANAARAVLENLVAAGVDTFDVASPAEIALLREVSEDAVLHYNNPVRSPGEIRAAVAAGVASYSVDGLSELEKLTALVPANGTELSVRLHLPVPGAAYDFGAKFGEGPDGAVRLLKAVRAAGFTPSMTFHPGTQCTDPVAWARYIAACAEVARRAGVRLSRLNVGGGFPAHRGQDHDLEKIFNAIATATRQAFGENAPALVCEPGRAMVAEAFTLACQVKAVRECSAVFLNDGLYGTFAEGITALGVVERISTLRHDGQAHTGAPVPRTVFGPTCDSLDRLPGDIPLPSDLADGDFVIFEGMGAYTLATLTNFNGYGAIETVTVSTAASR